MFLAHGPISYLANEKLQKKKIERLKLNDQILIAFLSLFFGILPDFDMFLLYAKDLPIFIHHNIITHTPFFYITIWILLKIGTKILQKVLQTRWQKILNMELANIIVDTFLISTIVHLLADLLVSNIMLLYPLSDIKLSILGNLISPNLFAGYLLSPFFVIEIFFILLFAFRIYLRFFKTANWGKILFATVLVTTTLFFPISLYICSSTYNDTSGVEKDRDMDGILDGMDSDIGNDGIPNMFKVSESEILDNTLDIVNSGKWASSQKDLRYRLGAFDSYRIISQAYINTGFPIEPVLRNGEAVNSNDYYYGKNLIYQDLLFAYLQDYLLELNLESSVNIPSSKIFFILDGEQNILNLGITLEGNYLAIVMDEDQKITMHSFEEVKNTYKDIIFLIQN